MLHSLRAAGLALASFVLLAAGEAPNKIAPEASADSQIVTEASPAVQLAALTPPPALDAALADDEALAAPETSQLPSDVTLRDLVGSITAMPSIELSEDMQCLATAVYFESKGEPLEGQLAVAEVIMNRVASGRWADSICGVVYQRGQFSFAWDRRSDVPSNQALWRVAQAIAIIAATDNWEDVSRNATHFHATHVTPNWRGLRKVGQVGHHIFYR